MNLVGKILTVFILVMSLFFCAFAVAVYGTHKNWRDVVMRPEDKVVGGKELGLMYQLENARNDYAKLQRERGELEKDLTAEKDAKVQALRKLENEYALLQDKYNTLDRDYKQINQERAEALARLKNTLVELAALRTDVEGNQDQGGKTPGLRKEVLQAEKDRDQYFNEVVRLSDELSEAITELNRLEERQQTLKVDLEKAVTVLRKFGYKPEPALYVDQPPVGLGGVVLAVTREGDVEINNGSDEGLLPGHRLEVYRPNGRYVARIEVLKTDVDRAVCQVVPGFQNSRVQKNDRVASRILR